MTKSHLHTGMAVFSEIHLHAGMAVFSEMFIIIWWVLLRTPDSAKHDKVICKNSCHKKLVANGL